MKTISVRLLDLIADAQGHQVPCGDIGNAFVQAFTKKKIYTRVGSEFEDRAGCIVLISRALYGLTTSADRLRTLFSNFLRTLGFHPTRFDRDVWMRMRDTKDGYDYNCTHVDDFKVVAHDAQMWIDRIASIFLIKSHDQKIITCVVITHTTMEKTFGTKDGYDYICTYVDDFKVVAHDAQMWNSIHISH